MGKYSQTLARLGAGYTVIGALVWLLWPSDLKFVSNPEAWFALAVAFVAWHFTEFKKSEALGAVEPTRHDGTVAARLFNAHRRDLRHLLNDTNLWSFVDVEDYHIMWRLLDDWKRGEVSFSHAGLNRKLNDFLEALEKLSRKVAQDTTEEMIAGRAMIGYKPIRIVPQDEYDRLMSESRKADALANAAWVLLEQLISDVRKHIPDAYADAMTRKE